MRTLDRRTFLSWAGAVGVLAGLPLARRARADAFEGPYVLTLHASGGWDPTLLCDPKGRASEDEEDPVNTYLTDDIEQVGPFLVAPLDGHRAFFERFRSQLLVINGVDTQTNSHEVGERFTWSGRMDPDSPALSALAAGLSPVRPSLGFLSNGGYDLTGGLVAPTRLGDTRTILELAYPDRLSETDPASTLLPAATLQRVADARVTRLDRQIDAATLPRVQRAWGLLREARLGDNELAALADVLPSNLDSGSDLRRQAQVAMACFAAGVTVSANLTIGGFDTHGDHDTAHGAAMRSLVDGLTFAMNEAERLGIADKVIVVVGSDFGRTPWYNDGAGKDHWSITSMMLMGPGIRGGRVVGGTTHYQEPRTVDPSTGALDDAGVRVTPADVHADLRRLLGVADRPELARWGVGREMGLLA
ncbi:MAG TPA: DUF1501 domain-containing protein [Myxococcota bacterium]|nr:DUF1501 domain-containing protein [Myxococcota bacterium]